MCRDKLPIHGQTIVFISVWLALMVFGRSQMFSDSGTYWHIAAGEKMLSTGQVLQTDPFSYSMHDQPWIAQQWLAECAMAVAYRIGGLDLLLLISVSLLALLFSIIAGRLFQSDCRPVVAATVLLLIAAGSSYHFLVRPHLVTIVMVGATQLILLDVESGRGQPLKLIILPLLLAVWTNLHGGALGGLAMISIVLGTWLIAPHLPILRRHVCDPAPAPLLGLTLCLAFLATLINPYSANLPAAWISLMQSSLLPQMIIEHAPLKIASTEGLSLLALATLYAFLLIRSCREQFRVAWIIPAIWFLLALGRVRHGPLFAISAGFCIADMLPIARPQRMLNSIKRHVWHENASFSPRPWLAPLIIIAGVAALQIANIQFPIIGAGWAQVPSNLGPPSALASLASELRTSPNKRVFNDMRFAGQLIQNVSDAQVYIDDRCELYGDHGLRRYVSILREPALFAGLAHYDDVSFAMISRGSRLDRYLASAPDWRCVHVDEIASVYRKK